MAKVSPRQSGRSGLAKEWHNLAEFFSASVDPQSRTA
jgi:hypothetical protein